MILNAEKLAAYNWLIEKNAAKAHLLPYLQNQKVGAEINLRAIAAARKKDIEAKQPEVYKGNKKRVKYDEFINGEDDGKHEDDGEIYGSIGIVYLRGAMISEGNWCVKGINEIIQEIKEFGADPNILGVMLVVDSPGGMVKGTETFANVVRNFNKNYGKKIFAYVEGMACSAAMWAISGADRIILAENTSMVGSIGTVLTLSDWREYQKMIGVKEIDVYATLSTEKNKAFADAIDGDTSTLVDTILNPTNLVFLRAIQANRGAKMGDIVKNLDLSTATVANTPDVLRGRVYVGGEAVAVGLVDKISKDGLEAELQLMQSYQRETAIPILPTFSAQDKTAQQTTYNHKYTN